MEPLRWNVGSFAIAALKFVCTWTGPWMGVPAGSCRMRMRAFASSVVASTAMNAASCASPLVNVLVRENAGLSVPGMRSVR